MVGWCSMGTFNDPWNHPNPLAAAPAPSYANWSWWWSHCTSHAGRWCFAVGECFRQCRTLAERDCGAIYIDIERERECYMYICINLCIYEYSMFYRGNNSGTQTKQLQIYLLATWRQAMALRSQWCQSSKRHGQTCLVYWCLLMFIDVYMVQFPW